MRQSILVSLILLTMLLTALSPAQASTPIGSGKLYIFGVGLTSDPSTQTVPLNTGTAVNTNLILPNINIGGNVPSLPSDVLVVAELTGPGISNPITVAARPGEQLIIPPLPHKGTYILDKIRLMIGDQTILYAEPSMATIDTLEKLLLTQVTSRPLSLDEIESLGITINPSNFTAYNFTVGFTTESGPVKMDLPVVLNYLDQDYLPDYGGGGVPGGNSGAPGLKVPNLHVGGFKMEPYEEEIPLYSEIPPIAGAIVIPGNIAFLNQFFEVMLLVTNNAPNATPLAVTDITAEISLPAGDDNIPQTTDDPLRVANTNQGAQSIVPVVNSIDRGRSLPPQGSGEGKFLVEGLREGTHQVNIDIKGTLQGLPSGPVQVKGKATGTVLVRNPYFSLTFGHPNVVREGEEYSLFVTVNNTSQVDANLVSLNLLPHEIYGATMIADSDPATPLGTVQFRTIRAGDSAVAEYKFIARRTGRVTSAAFQGGEGVKGVFNLRTGIGEKGIPLSPDSLILSSYVKHLPEQLLYEAMRVLGLAHSIATAPVLPAGIARIPRHIVEQRAYELTEAGLRIKMGEPIPNSICGLLLDWSGDIMPDQNFESLLMTTDAGADFTSEAGSVTGYNCPEGPIDGPKVISVMQLPEADQWDRGRTVAILFDTKIKEDSANNPANYRLIYRTLTKELKNPPKGVKILPGKRIIEVMFQATVSPFFEYDLIVSGIKGPSLRPMEPEPTRMPVITTFTKPGGIVSGAVRKGDGSPIPHTEVFLYETFQDTEGTFTVITNRTSTDAEGNYQLDYVAMAGGLSPPRIDSSDPATGQSGSMNPRIIMDRQHLRLDILLLGLGTLTGQVIRAEDQSPVKGALITANSLTDSKTYSAFSDANGRFAMQLVPVGNLNISAEAGLYKGSVAARIPSAGATADITVPVYKTDVTGSLKGRVFDADARTPVAGLPIIIGNGTDYGNWQYADQDGGFLFEGVPSGTINVKTFRQETGEQTDANVTVSANLSTTVNLVLPGTATIMGTVYDYKGLPVPGAEVLAGITLVITDANGNFVIDRAPLGTVSVTAGIPNTADYANVSVDIGVPGEIVRVSITLPHISKGTIQGYVKNPSGQALPYQKVLLYDGRSAPVTVSADSQGYFKKELPVANYTVRIVNGDLSDGDMKPANLVLEGQTITLELRFKGFGRITGTVFQPDGVSPTIASVYITKTYYTSIGTPYQKKERFISDQLTDGGLSGRFVIDKAPVGDFRLEASNAFYSQPVVRLGRVNNPDETVIMDIVLQPTSTVSGQVFLASGQRAGAGLPVTLTPSKSVAKMQVNTRDDGTFEFNLVPPEGFTLTVYDPISGNFGMMRGSVETGDEAVVDINILGKGTARVKVIDGSGNPLPGARVQLNSGSAVASLFREFPRITTDSNGEAVFSDVPEGSFSVTAEDPYTLTGGRSGGVIPEDLTEINVTVIVSSSGTLTGYIRTPDDTGTVPFAQVKLSMSGRPDFFTTSDADGLYTFTYVPLGAFKIEVFHPGTGRSGRAEGRIDYNTEILSLDVSLIAQGTVEGFVYTASGEVVPKAKVEIRSLDLIGSGTIRMTTNLEGRFRASGIPEGRYSVKATDDIKRISGMAEGLIATEGELVRTDVYLQPTGTIYGRALAANGITPISYAEVTLTGGFAGSAVTDFEGNYSFRSIPLGSYTLTAKEQNGFDGGRATTVLSYEGHLNNTDILFIGTGNIQGRVVRADGLALGKEAVLTLKRTGLFGGTFTGYSDLDGYFTFSGIPTGDFSVSAKLPGSLLGGVYSGSLTDGTTLQDIVISIEDSGEITGSVLRQDGITPCKDALVMVTLTASGYRTFTVYAVTGADGSFSFKEMPLGQFTMTVMDFYSGGAAKASGGLTLNERSVILAPIVLDERKPTVSAITPASGSVQIPLNAAITISFSEAVDPYSVNSYSIKVTGGSTPITGSLSLSSDRKAATFTPSSNLPEFIPVTVTVKSIRDDMGKTMDGTVISTFTTADITAPRVLSAKLIKGNFVVEFSEPVVQGTGLLTVTNSATGQAVAGVLTFSAGNTVATLYPSAPLPDNVSFELTISRYKDAFGNTQVNSFSSTYLTGDKIPPQISLTSSAPVAIEGTNVVITALPLNSSDIYTVDFRVNGVLVQSLSKAPYAITIRPVGTVTVTAIPTDYVGNMGAETSITVQVVPNMPPSSAILSPATNTSIGSGRSVAVRAQATDDLGLKEIELRVRSLDISFTQVYAVAANSLSSTHDFSFTIPTTTKPGNDIRVEVIARDVRGLESLPAAITLLTEDKTPPMAKITSFTQGFHVQPGQTIPVTVYASDNWAVSRIDFKTEGGLVLTDSRVIDPPLMDASATFNLTIPANYAGGTKITVAPSASDPSGNIGYAPKITLVTDDVTPPTVEIVSPSNGATVLAKSNVKITARALDNDLVDRVEFFIDGKLFATDKVASGGLYDASFIVPSLEGTTISISVKAYDASGNSSALASAAVGIVNDNILPVVTMLSNIANMRFNEGHVAYMSVSATDNIGVSSVELFVNDRVVSTFTNPASSTMTFSYTVENLIPQGMTSIHVPLEVKATDPDGNIGTSGIYNIEIFPDNPPAVTISSPMTGQDVLGGAKTRIDAKATDDFGIKTMEIRVNGTTVSTGATSTITTDYQIPASAMGSTITVEVLATDTLGRSASKTVDLSVPLSVSQVSGVSTGGEVIDTVIHNGYAWLLEKGSGISVIDVRDVSAPVKTGALSIAGNHTGMEVFEGVIYIYGLNGVTMVDSADPLNPRLINSYQTSNPITGIAFRSGFAYCANGSGGLLILDVHDPNHLTGMFRSISDVKGVDIEGDNLYIAHGQASPSLSVYSLADPVNPVRVSSYGTAPVNAFDSGGITGIGMTGNNRLTSFAYNSGFSKLSDLTLTRINTINAVDLKGQYAFFSSGVSGWGMAKVSASGAISDMGSVSLGSTNKVVLSGGYIYASDGTAGLRVYKLESLNAVQPAVNITSPVSGASISRGSEIDVTADVTGADISSVTFYRDGKEVFTDDAAPYTYRFRVPNTVTALTIKAGAYDLNGLYTESSEVLLNVIEENVSPTISITSPDTGGSTPVVFEGTTLSVRGSAQDNFGVAKVECFINGNPLGSTLLSTFDFGYFIPDDGVNGTDYLIEVMVRATDVSGNISETIFNVRVVEDNPPQVTLVTPLPGTEVYRGAVISLSVRATDDRGISEVRFYEGTNLLGTGTLATGDVYSMSYRVPDVTQDETRTFTAEVTDFAGQTASVETSIVVKPPMTGVIISVGDNASVVAVQDDIAVTGGTNGMLRIYNIGVPTSPVLVGSLNLVEEIRQVKIVGSRVYAVTTNYMKIIDIANPAAPVQLSATYRAGSYSVDVFDSTAFLGFGAYVDTYDVNGQSPVYKTSKYVGAGTIRDMRIDGQTGRLYVAVDNSSSSYLSVFDASNVASLIEIGRVTIPGNPRRLEVVGDKAYIANNTGMVIVDVKNSIPYILGSIDTPGTGTDVKALGNKWAFVADGTAYGLTIVDVTNSTAPVQRTSIDTPGSAKEVAIAKGYAFVADGTAGLTVIELGDTPPFVRADLISIGKMKLDGTVDVTGLPKAVIDEEMTVQVRITNLGTGITTTADITSGSGFVMSVSASFGDELVLEALDSYQGSGPIYLGQVPAGEVVGRYTVNGTGQTVDVSGNIAVMGEKEGTLTIFDITDPLNPVKLSSMNLVEEIRQVRIVGSRVYAATTNNMKIIDIANPAAPVQLTGAYRAGSYSVEVFDTTAFLAWSYYIDTYDVNGQSPVYKTSKYVGAGTIRDMRIDGLTGRIYVAVDNSSNSYLSVFDANNVTSLVEIGRVTIPGNPRRLELVGDKVYIATKTGMVIVSLSRLGTAVFGADGNGDGRADDILSYTLTTGGAYDLDVKGNYAYIADGLFNGVKVMDVTDPTLPKEVAHIGTPGDAVEIKVMGVHACVADGPAGLSVVELYNAEAVPSVDLDLVGAEVNTSTMTLSIIGATGAVRDNVYPVIVRITSYATGQTYETMVSEADNGAFTVNMPWIIGDELYISLVESTPNPLTVGPTYLGQVPAGEVVGRYTVNGTGQTVDVSGNIAVMGEKEGTLTIFDITDPLNPVKLSSMNLVEEIRQVRIVGSRVYAATTNNMKIIDISNPAAPVQLTGAYRAGSYSVEVFDTTAFLAWSYYIDTYDVNGQSPVYKTSKYVGAGTIRDMRIDGLTGRLYAAVDNGSNSYLSVFDANNVTSLVEIGRVTIPGNPRRLELVGDKVYIAVKTGMVIVSLSRLGTANFGADGNGDGRADDILNYTLTTGGAYDLDVKGNYAYIADGLFNGVKVMDVTDPTLPKEVARINTLGDAVEVKIIGTHAYVADGYAGLSVMELYY